jgi:mannose-6-phosphate isomerase-like protein (cupin superfamily)
LSEDRTGNAVVDPRGLRAFTVAAEFRPLLRSTGSVSRYVLSTEAEPDCDRLRRPHPVVPDRDIVLGGVRRGGAVRVLNSPEVAELRSFRDRLRGDPALLAQYVALKRRIIAEGVTDSLDYSIRKSEFIASILRDGMIPKVNIREKLALFHDHWSPKIVGELNGHHVKLVKLQGEFVWHKHDDEDELFLVIQGRFRMEYRDRHVRLEEGDFLIVPRGVEHRPVAEEEVHVLLFEPAGTLNTGDIENERTVRESERI